MRFSARVPRFVSSSIETGPTPARPVLDGRDVIVPNRWNVPPHTVALVGRPAVDIAFALTTPRIPLGVTTIPARRLHLEVDVGGHLFVLVTGADASSATIVEGGPYVPDGTGALVPFAYPEDEFAARGIVDFAPLVIPPPHGLSHAAFADLVRATQRAYDGNQRYLAIEIPFLRVGRDSNSYAIGVLLSCGVDPRAIPKPKKAMRNELTGYPGAEDPVHRANFGTYMGAPTDLGDGVVEIAYHNDDGGVRLVLVGGKPGGTARLPDGSTVPLDERGRIVFLPDEAQRHGLPTKHTDPPAHIRDRTRFPTEPDPAGARITLVVDGTSVPLDAGTSYRGTIVARHDAAAIATLRADDGRDVVLPLAELGVELRDPKRVDALVRAGNELTVGLRADRRPHLVAHGATSIEDRLRPHRPHLPRPLQIAGLAALGVGILAGAAAAVAAFRSRRD
jgi:hypothetical protein